ncbi:MAG: hypothetical protein Q4P35_05540 [Clostridia bacterium]|nr:hypothetical protein [Clostridia bacterium]
MVKLNTKDIYMDKYMDTDIDELRIFFQEVNDEGSLVNEIDLPKDVMSVVTYAMPYNHRFYKWFYIANPIALQEVLKIGKFKLPVIEFEFEKKIYTLEEFLKNINLNNYK